jgi:hypothetical protein
MPKLKSIPVNLEFRGLNHRAREYDQDISPAIDWAVYKSIIESVTGKYPDRSWISRRQAENIVRKSNVQLKNDCAYLEKKPENLRSSFSSPWRRSALFQRLIASSPMSVSQTFSHISHSDGNMTRWQANSESTVCDLIVIRDHAQLFISLVHQLS